MKTLGFLSVLGLLVIVSGCATPNRKPVAQPVGNIVTEGLAMVSNCPPRDRVLWQYRTAAALMRAAKYQQARALLDDALLTLGGVYGKDKTAKKARGYFSAENKKNFIGEPYERVMAHYYRGILYWMDGEPDNARACFRSGQVEDSSTEEKYTSDYVLLDYLDGLATCKLGADGTEGFKRAAGLCSHGEKLPEYDLEANVLCFVEFGKGPFKFATGKYHEELKFGVDPCDIRSARLRVEGRTIPLGPYDDLGYQATTRGGRVMDHVLANKVVFKKTSETIGSTALVGGAAVALASQNQTAREVGLGLAAAGAVVQIISMATTPAADVRTWDNLPRYLGFGFLHLPPGQHSVRVEFCGEDGQAFQQLDKTLTLNVPEGKRETVLFFSDRTCGDQPPQVANAGRRESEEKLQRQQ